MQPEKEINDSWRDDGETDVALVFRWDRVVWSRLLHAPAGPGEGETRQGVALCARVRGPAHQPLSGIWWRMMGVWMDVSSGSDTSAASSSSPQEDDNRSST